MPSMDTLITRTPMTTATTLMVPFPSIIASADSIISMAVTMKLAIGEEGTDPSLLPALDGTVPFQRGKRQCDVM